MPVVDVDQNSVIPWSLPRFCQFLQKKTTKNSWKNSAAG